MSDNCKYEYRPTIGHDAHGKPIRKSFYGKTKKAARAKAEKWLIENAISAQNGEIKTAPLTRDVFEEYITHKKIVVKANSLYNLKSQFKKVLKEFGDIPIDKIKHNDIVKYIDKLSEVYAPATVMMHKINMSGLFKYAVRCEYISQNPCAGIKIAKDNENKEKDTYTQDETDFVTDYCRTHEHGLAIDLMLSYGTTISETLGIRYKSVDFENKTISIIEGVTAVAGQTIVDTPKNRFRYRTIAVTDETLEHIRRKHEQFPEGEYLIHYPDKDGPVAPWYFRNHMYNPFMIDMAKQASSEGREIKMLKPHDLRHTRATLWVEQDVNLFAIAEEMGWSSLKMLRTVYGHPNIQKLRKMLFRKRA